MTQQTEDLKQQILKLVREYSALVHRANLPGSKNHELFVPGKTIVPYAGRVFDADEVEAAVSSTLDFWLTLGPEGDAFQSDLASFLGVRSSVLTNSGSSANLLAISTLTSHKLPKDRRLMKGDEVITCAAGFPTTVAPIIQNGLTAVFVDNDPVSGNIDAALLEEAFHEGRTKALIAAHTLGNPFNLAEVSAFCRRHNLWLIEDNCDCLGSTYTIPAGHPLASAYGGAENVVTRPTGSWGDLSTQSFYPPHHLTMGEGGAVNIVSDAKLKKLVESYRDWGRDCWCASGRDNTCKNRFGWQLGELPRGYDHKYIYSHIGYNIKPLDLQAAIGRMQMKKLPDFVHARKANWEYLRRGLAELEDHFAFALPTHATGWTPEGFAWDETGCRADCSWFGFMMLVKPGRNLSREKFAAHLEEKKIGNRMLFGGNLVRQPAFVQLRKDYPEALRTVGNLSGADRIMNEAVFIGVYPGLTRPMLDYVIDTIHAYVKGL